MATNALSSFQMNTGSIVSIIAAAAIHCLPIKFILSYINKMR